MPRSRAKQRVDVFDARFAHGVVDTPRGSVPDAAEVRGDDEDETNARLVTFGAEGGVLAVGSDDEGAYAVLEGMPHIEIVGTSIPAVLRELATQLERNR